MNNIVSAKLDSRYASTLGVWQYDYGQVLRITGPELPPAVEVQFSLDEKLGETLSRVGTTVDGVTEVKIPDELLTHSATSNYRIYAYIYLTDETSGNTKYEITIPVRVRSKPTSPAEDPETDPDLFRETVVAVNASADRAKMAEQNAKESATEAGKYAASASESAVAAEKTKEDALRKVGEKEREAIEAIQNQEETSVGKITTHTDGEIQRIKNQTAESKGELEQTIINAGVSEKELEHSIETAGTSKTALDKSVELAGTAKTELDTSIREAGTAKTALDESTETAGTVQETLSATVKQAGVLDTSLGENIETGTQLKTDLTASGEKAVQDIQAAGSEQLGKMQAVAEEFTADREQIATNKEDIGSLKEDLSNKITKFYASNQGETHLADSDNGKIMDMMLYGRSEQKQYKGINLLPPDTNFAEYIEVSIPKGSFVFWATDGTPAIGGNFRFFNEDKTEDTWLGIDSGTTSLMRDLTIDAKYVQILIDGDFDLSKICLGIGNEPIYEPYVGGKPSPSPDYPQEIKSVGDSGSVAVKVMGKNLLPTNCGQNITALRYDAQYNRWAFDALKPIGMVNLRIIDPMTAHYLLSPGTYTITLVSFENVQNVTISAVNADWKTLATVVPGRLSKTFSVDANTIVGCYFVPEDANATGCLQVQLELGTTATSYEPYTEQFVQLPYTLNAIPVASGGNVTIDGQQYVADYVDVERGKVVRMCGSEALNTKNGEINEEYRLAIRLDTPAGKDGGKECIFSTFKWSNWTTCVSGTSLYIKNIKKPNNELYTAQELKELSIDFDVIYQLLEQQETDLTPEQTQALKELVTYYPVTNISVNSDQLDGYTVFNYPISMANGWNYVKQQLNDNRDYIYDMDIQSAEAYVNSEYAVALAELEV